MFSSNKRNNGKKSIDWSQFGLLNSPDEVKDSMDYSDPTSDNDSDLEAELAAITSGNGASRKKPSRPPPILAADLSTMVAASLKDIDENVSSADEDDPDLLNELQDITGASIEIDNDRMDITEKSETDIKQPEVLVPTTQVNISDVIKSRIEMYKVAEDNAKKNNDTSRARRFARGLKTLNDVLKQANAGRSINIDDLPPEVVTKSPIQPNPLEESNPPENAPTVIPVSIPVRPAPSVPLSIPIEIEDETTTITTTTITTTTTTTTTTNTSANKLNESVMALLLQRQREYKLAALNAKRDGQTDIALKYVRVIKMFDAVIKAAQDGQKVDLSDMPPPPSEMDLSIFDTMPTAGSVPDPAKEEAEKQTSHEEPPTISSNIARIQRLSEEPTTLLEALNQRLDLYKSIEQSAKSENNNSKARRFGRIVKQYEDAIKLYKAGKPVPVDDLPTPPNFPSLPASTDNQKSTNPTVAPKLIPTPRDNSESPVIPQRPPRPKLQKQDSRVSGNHSSTTVMNKNISIILERQQEFKKAAISAKKANELDEAKEYLKIFKALENLLDVARGGMPVDLSTLPIPPSQRAQLEDSFVVVDTGDCTNNELNDISQRLEEQLQKQLTMCKTTRDHNKALGDVAGTNRFENLALGIQKDLDFVRIARRNNLPIPKCHYENKSFNILRCNTDLTETDLEIHVIRGISYNVANPRDIDTYVKIECPLPQENPYKTRTQLVKDTDNPEYNEKFTLEIQPKVRQCQRVFKRHSVKFEIYSKGSMHII